MALPFSPGHWVQRWIYRRIPPADEVTLDRNTIFVLPTGEGVMFGVLLVICLLTGINYQNSLIYLFTFIMGTVFFGTIMQTFQNLANLRLTVIDVGQAEAGQPVPVTIRVVALDGSQRPAVSLSFPDQPPVTFSVEGHQGDPVVLALPTRKRGLVNCGDIRIASVFPFGLIRTWSFLRPSRQGVATPRPIPAPATHLAASHDSDQEQGRRFVRGADDTTLRGYREGDSLQRVQWKRYARTGQMVVADWEEPAGDPSWVSWADYPGVDPEMRLSYMADRVEHLCKSELPFGLELPGQTLQPDYSPGHRGRCLRALGTYGHNREAPLNG
ncbi:MAG: DUF58 domain-containing protein [Halomonadaceae bacterium]|nr:MAG: DUF58 domain-containing protein [Halomonadaceae bacterium]